MSTVAESESGMMCHVASGGIAEIDDIKLKDCTISDDDDSKLKRDAESDDVEPVPSSESPKSEGAACEKKREIIGVYRPSFPLEILFKQPEGSNLGDCPICMIPLSLETKQWSVYSCCGKIICDGCNFFNQKREWEMKLGEPRCAFCRHLIKRSKDEAKRNEKKKLAANDPATLRNVGAKCLNSMKYKSAYKYLSKAVELGEVEAHFYLSIMYSQGYEVKKDMEKEVYHLEQAAVGGHPSARYNLGNFEWVHGDRERAMKHYMISASLGCNDTISWLVKAFKMEKISKDYLTAALRAHQTAVAATKSPQRKEAEEAKKRCGGSFGGK